ncbi:hypothetical protein HBB16_04350 [Pseudonocardia sp. MCCB 268]|nr:hypothetical protein [Pseudonocardia cytotoxica]
MQALLNSLAAATSRRRADRLPDTDLDDGAPELADERCCPPRSTGTGA